MLSTDVLYNIHVLRHFFYQMIDRLYTLIRISLGCQMPECPKVSENGHHHRYAQAIYFLCEHIVDIFCPRKYMVLKYQVKSY